MHILRQMTVGYSSDPLFGERLSLDFDDRVNVFIGPNGCGKTTLLHSIAQRAPGFVDSRFVTHGDLYMGAGWDPRRVYQELWGFNLTDDDVERLWDSDHPDYDPDWDLKMFPWAFLPATRIAVPDLGDSMTRTHLHLFGADASLDYDKIARNILSFLRSGNPFDDSYVWLPMDNLFVFNANILENIIAAMVKHFHTQSQGHFIDEIIDTCRIAGNCARDIAGEVMVGQPDNYASVPDGRSVNEPSVHPGMGISVSYAANGEVRQVYVGQLSAGTQGVYLWILYVALKMAVHYKFEEGWEKRPAVLLIDEIENHLHPTWQRRVIPALLDHFTGLQIFAATHSPFVVAGREAGQVHLLNRDSKGAVTVSTNTEAIIGWTVDEILRVMMGVQDPTDDKTALGAAELRRLRDEGPRTSQADEEQRQDRIQELRRLVDRDLLAGGPMAARRELFEQQFNEALEKYRQSRDLGQENG